MDRIDESAQWSEEGLGIAIRMQHGDFGRGSRTPFYLRLAAVLLSVTTLAILLGVGGWYAWRSYTRRAAEEEAAADTLGATARG